MRPSVIFGSLQLAQRCIARHVAVKPGSTAPHKLLVPLRQPQRQHHHTRELLGDHADLLEVDVVHDVHHDDIKVLGRGAEI
jgi:hypothetical protein